MDELEIKPTLENIEESIPKQQNEEKSTQETEVIRYKEMKPSLLVLKRFFRSRLSIIGLVMIVVLFIFSFLGPVILHACGYQWYEITTDETQKVAQVVDKFSYIDSHGNTVWTYQIIDQVLNTNKLAGISSSHFLGTDEKGMDVFIRLMYGGRISLTLGFVVVFLESFIGIVLGGISGYFGKWVDQIIMRIVDIFNCIPTLPILLIASAVLESWGIDPKFRIYYLMIIMTLFGWSGTARIVRGQILSLREQEFIVATDVMGIPVRNRIFKHLVPNIMPQLIVSMTLGLGSTILYESTLSYLNLGIPIPYAAWGTMIASSNDPTILQNYPWLWIPAGVLIIIAVLGFNFIGDGLRDAMDPKAKR